MTTDIGHTTIIVKRDYEHTVDIRRAVHHDYGVSRRSKLPHQWDSLEKRVDWVLARFPLVVRSREDWSLKAGLSRQFLSSAISRSRKEGSLTVDALEKLTDVPGLTVDPFWLGTGRGTPDRRPPMDIDHLPQRAQAAKRAIADGCPQDVVDEIRSDPQYDTKEWESQRADVWYGLFMKVAFQRAQEQARAREEAAAEAERKAG